MGRSRQQKPARSSGLNPAAIALLAAIVIPIGYGIVLNWRMFAADDWDRSSLGRIALCVVAAAAIAAAGLALPRGTNEGRSAPGALGLLVGAAVTAAIALAVIAVAPWLLTTAVCDILPTPSLYAFWCRESFSNSVERTMAFMGFAVMVLTIGALSWAASRNRAQDR
jgi:hypothetical protein